MSYASVDALQNTLSETVFHYATDRKKAAGRALGTLIEIITFYTIRSWGFRDSVAIEKPIPEYGNPVITHNVEYSIHGRVLSNHGNWFTSENHNKELKVLAQSYGWLLFLTDAGFVDFINELLLNPTDELAPAREAFLASYTGDKGKNRFTKVQMDAVADEVLVRYFATHAARIESWFNIITPSGQNLSGLRSSLTTLSQKNWKAIHNL